MRSASENTRLRPALSDVKSGVKIRFVLNFLALPPKGLFCFFYSPRKPIFTEVLFYSKNEFPGTVKTQIFMDKMNDVANFLPGKKKFLRNC